MQDLGSAAALFLAAVFAWAGAVKLVNPGPTAQSFRALDLPMPRLFGRAVPLVELSTAALLVLAPRAGGVVALGCLVAFTAFVLNALRHGKRVGCGCFGATHSTEDLSYVEPTRNLLLGIAAVMTMLTPQLTPPTLAAVVAVTAAAIAAALGLGLLRLRQRVGVVWATPLPGSFPSR
ncbi:MAG TPA: MauE/DoxX family redox-associated membrane protein [Acidimicrobiales bacterium]|nr:MauE/DoxX family redox-associated membrane protein [Acidimicrobiales bacterium]